MLLKLVGLQFFNEKSYVINMSLIISKVIFKIISKNSNKIKTNSKLYLENYQNFINSIYISKKNLKNRK